MPNHKTLQTGGIIGNLLHCQNSFQMPTCLVTNLNNFYQCSINFINNLQKPNSYTNYDPLFKLNLISNLFQMCLGQL